MDKIRLGVIGLGAMGKPMSRNLLKHGFPVFCYDKKKEPLEEVALLDAVVLESPGSVADESEIILTILPFASDVREVVLGRDGLISHLKEGKILIEMSTISPSVTKEIETEVRKTGAKMIDAPVSGGKKGAEEGTLSIMVGGEKDVFEKCGPVFAAVGEHFFHVGSIGAGVTVKLIVQYLVAINLIGACEAIALGKKLGLDIEFLYEILRHSAAASKQLDSKMPMFLTGSYRPGFRLDLMEKDIRYALDMAREARFPLIMGGIAHAMFIAAQAHGKGDLDVGALMSVLEKMAKENKNDNNILA